MLTASSKIFLVKLKWFLWKQLSSVWDFILLLFNFPVSYNDDLKQKEKKVIVYLGELLPPRISRMAKWVKRSSDFATVLVCSKQGFFEKFSDPNFDSVFLFRNAFHLKRIVKQIPNIHLIHAFAPKSFYPDIIRRAFKHKFIADYQDVYGIYYGLNPSLRWLKKELPYEKACLEHADGIVAHSLEPNVALRKYDIKKKPKTIFFPLYCDDDSFCENKKNISPENIHIVYAGGVAGSHRNPRQYGNIQFHWLIEKLSSQKIHFHIYPSPSNFPADYEEYKFIEKQNMFFHFHNPIAQNKLAMELSKYHFGILPFFRGDSQQGENKYKFATTLKLFNYIEAGIPVLVSKDIIYQSWIVERYKAGIILSSKKDIDNLKEIILKMEYKKLSDDLKENRNKISLSRNIPRLIKFYDRIRQTTIS
ncbi:MAG: hypothetical protein V1781_01310 [Bacteroidota bacterium]